MLSGEQATCRSTGRQYRPLGSTLTFELSVNERFTGRRKFYYTGAANNIYTPF
jgi:hypothetical protein